MGIKMYTIFTAIYLLLKALIENQYLLKKFPGKGGWTYALIPEISPNKGNPFGWVKVRGSIDGYEISKYHLMPFGKGKLFLPIRAEIRKKIKKYAGDTVTIVLFEDHEPYVIPQELLDCLENEKAALQFFISLPENEQHQYVKWVFSAKKEETKANRILVMISRLLKEKKLNEL